MDNTQEKGPKHDIQRQRPTGVVTGFGSIESNNSNVQVLERPGRESLGVKNRNIINFGRRSGIIPDNPVVALSRSSPVSTGDRVGGGAHNRESSITLQAPELPVISPVEFVPPQRPEFDHIPTSQPESSTANPPVSEQTQEFSPLTQVLSQQMDRREVIKNGAEVAGGLALGAKILNILLRRTQGSGTQYTQGGTTNLSNTQRETDTGQLHTQAGTGSVHFHGDGSLNGGLENSGKPSLDVIANKFISGYSPQERQQLLQLIKNQESFYTTHDNFETKKKNTLAWTDTITQVAEEFKNAGVVIDNRIIKLLPAFIFVESGGNERAISPTKAAGLCQFEPLTAQEVEKELPPGFIQQNLSELNDKQVVDFLISHPKESIMLALRLLQDNFNQYASTVDGNMMAIQAYNMGTGTIDKIRAEYQNQNGGEIVPNFLEMINSTAFKNAGLRPETKDYAPQILAAVVLLDLQM